jgi:2-methylfumaryl-CoA hydratase
MGMAKAFAGRFFEDYRVGERIEHAVPRTLTTGDLALYGAIYPSRFALASSDAFAQACGLPGATQELAAFHIVFGKSVPDLSLNAVANLGYAEGRFLRPVLPGTTLVAASEVIGLKETSSRRTGVVWVRTTGRTETGEAALSFVRWVMVRKRDAAAEVPPSVVPDLAEAVAAADLVVPEGLDFSRYDHGQAGECWRLGDYTVGERIDHLDRVTIDEAEHMMATRLWQNTARVHFDVTAREDGRRLVYGGHVLSLARALAFNGLANAQPIVAINAGTHANPCFAGDTVSAWSEVLDLAETGVPGVGAIRLRLVAVRAGEGEGLRDAEGRYLPHVLLDFDHWALMPT